MLLISLGLLVVAAQSQPQTSGETIVVTARPLDETDHALKQCLARQCPPNEDIAATLAHAENQFVAGNYKDARATLAASARRNKRHAEHYPVPVSDLMRASARVAAHLGLGEAFRMGALDSLSALKAGLPSTDARVLVAEVELADAFFSFGRVELAFSQYRGIARRARALDLPIVEGFAMLREASARTQVAEIDPKYLPNAREALRALAASEKPAHAAFKQAGRVLEARLAAGRGDESRVEAVLAEFRASRPSQRPVLLFSRPIDLAGRINRDPSTEASALRVSAMEVEDQWIDVSYFIGADGLVRDADILRASRRLNNGWPDAVLASVRSRRFAPLAVDAGGPGMLRVERYTYTARGTKVTGSWMKQPGPLPRIEMLDLSVDAPPIDAPS